MKPIALAAAGILLLSCTGCSLFQEPDTQGSSALESAILEDEPITLENRMTDTERERTVLEPFDETLGGGCDQAALQQLRTSLRQLRIYDQELDMEFLARVILPPEYDPKEKYPLMLTTDGLWRTGLLPQAPLQEDPPPVLHQEGDQKIYYRMDPMWQLTDVPAIRELMPGWKYQDVILVCLGFPSYPEDWQEEKARMETLLVQREALLNFVSDNLMPCLGDNFSLKYETSSLCGYSAGALFSHYALCRRSQYTNLPFHGYMVADPTFSAYSTLKQDTAPDAWKNGFGFTDRYLVQYGLLWYSSELEQDLAESLNGVSEIDAFNEQVNQFTAALLGGSFGSSEGHYGSNVSPIQLEFFKKYYINE